MRWLLPVAMAIAALLAVPAFASASGTISYPDAITNAPTTSVAFSSAGDVASRQVERRTAMYMGGLCGAFGGWASLGPVDPTSPWVDATTADGQCYEYRLRMTDSFAVTTYATTASTVKVDRTVPMGTIDAAPFGPVSGTVTLTGTSADSASGVDHVTVGVMGQSPTSICTAPIANPWNCTWNTIFETDGMHDIQLVVHDNAGNISLPITRTIMVDNNPPTSSFDSFVESIGQQFLHQVGSTIFYNPAQSGSFDVRISASDAAAGINSVDFPSFGSGWSPVGGGQDTTGTSPYSLTYGFSPGAAEPGLLIATAFDNAGSSATTSFSVLADSGAPTGASVTVPSAPDPGNASISFVFGSDVRSGIGSWQLQRRTASLAGGVCGVYGAWSNAGSASAASPFLDTGAVAGMCYQYRLDVTDNVGNQATASSPTTAQVEAPGGPGVVMTGGTPVVDESGSTSDMVSIALATAPSSNVVLTATADGQVNLTPSTLTFTPVNWHVPQGLMLSAVDDAIDESSPHVGSVDFSVASADTAYSGISVAPVVVDIMDDDTSGVNVTPVQVDVTEGGASDTLEISLVSEPTGDVTIDLTPDSQVATSTPAITFTAADWNIPQSVTVTAIDDAVDEPDPHVGLITMTATSTDTMFDALAISDVTVDITDNDVSAPGDTTPPTGASITAPSGLTNSTSAQVTFTIGTDADSGIASWQLQRRTASGGRLVNGGCAAFGAWTNEGPANPASPYIATPTNGTCVQYQLRVTDNAGNVATSSTTGSLQVDATAPTGSFSGPHESTPDMWVLGGLSHDTVSDAVIQLAASGPASATPCTQQVAALGKWGCTWSTSSLPAGTYSVVATIRDAAGNSLAFTRTVSVTHAALPPATTTPNPTADTQDPTATIASLPKVDWTGRSTVSWTGSDDSGTAPSYQVIRRVFGYKTGWSPWKVARTWAASTSMKAPSQDRGSTACFRVIARDAAGNTATSAQTCTSVPLDDRDLTRTGTWASTAVPGAWLSTISTSRRRSATLSFTTVARRLQLIVATCPTCGKVRVMRGSRVVSNVTMGTKSTRLRQLRRVPLLAASSRGPIRLVVASGGPRIDGILILP